jgi:alpha-L-fucosidase
MFASVHATQSRRYRLRHLPRISRKTRKSTSYTTRMAKIALPILLGLGLLTADVRYAPPKPFGAVPSARQLAWHQLETFAFLHFSPNTFTDKEWGYGDEDPALFNPTDFDANQIVLALKAGGMTGAILTAKHHDGFCLWPTKTTKHSVAGSPWRGGRGDVVREIADACRRHGLKFGIYLSPWDRNHPAYGAPAYVDVYRSQLRELLTGYGPIFEVWHDGANGGDGYYGGAREKRTIDRRTYYDWPTTWKLVRELQPGAVIFSDVGPDVRWVGNEKGIASPTNWATFTPVGEDGGPAAPGWVRTTESGPGHRGAAHWLPAECNTSIRPGWFFHDKENDRVRTAQQLVDLYDVSVGRGCNLHLNVPPDRRGRVHDTDVTSLATFGRTIRDTFAVNLAAGAKAAASNVRSSYRRVDASRLLDGDPSTYWTTDDDVTTAEVTLDMAKPTTFSVVRVREHIALGQRVEAFGLDYADAAGAWREIATGTTIGQGRILRLPQAVTASRVRLRITKALAAPVLTEVGLYK